MPDAILLLLIVLTLLLAGIAVVLVTRSVMDSTHIDRRLRNRWISGRRQVEREELTEVAKVDLVSAFLLAEDVEIGMPRRIELYTDRTQVIGRDRRQCDVVLRDIGISRRHAQIWFTDDKFQVRDMRSKGGTFVNRQRLRSNEQRPLDPGDLIQFYNFGYRFEQADEKTFTPDPGETEY